MKHFKKIILDCESVDYSKAVFDCPSCDKAAKFRPALENSFVCCGRLFELKSSLYHGSGSKWFFSLFADHDFGEIIKQADVKNGCLFISKKGVFYVLYKMNYHGLWVELHNSTKLEIVEKEYIYYFEVYNQ